MNSRSRMLRISKFDSLGRRSALVLAFIFIVVAFSGLGALIQGKKEVALSQIITSDPSLHEALESALKKINELRKKDRSTIIDCTDSFGDFKHYQDIGPYISFFKSIEIEATLDDRNGRHYAAFYFDPYKLSKMGFRSFLRSDTLVIVFTTASASSTTITSFKCSLLNDGHL